MINEKYGSLTVISAPFRKKNNTRIETYVSVKCVCGVVKDVRTACLKNGDTTSCGCFRTKRIIESLTTHGLTKHPIYIIWRKVKERCYCKTSKDYPNYGAKGVVMCKAWLNFKSFYDWAINNGWKKGLQIDKDIKGNGKMYSPSKCMFVTSLENNRHQTTTKLNQDLANKIRDLYSTNKYTQVELAAMFSVKQSTISTVLLNQKWQSNNYSPQRNFTRKQSPKIENSMMNICRKNNVSYWAIIHRIRRTKESFSEALAHLMMPTKKQPSIC